MKSALALVLVALSTLAFASPNIVHQRHDAANKTCGEWLQKPKGCASFTSAHDCSKPSCGVRVPSGFVAAVNELAFGANSSFGDACGRCFKITPTKDPYSPKSKGPFGNTIIVKVNNLCLDREPGNTSTSNPHWCGQTVSKPRNKYGMEMHFDLCDLTGASQAFFPDNTTLAMLGNYEEVSCNKWTGTIGSPLWNGSCLANNPPFWPKSSCGNRGCPPQ